MVGDVVRAVDPDVHAVEYGKPLGQLWNRVSDAVDTILDGVSLADLVVAGASSS
jgi:DNA-binding IscR family transcriptional regulator